VDGRTALSVVALQGVEEFLDGLRNQLKDRSFRPLPVRERMIPKANGTSRRLGIPTIADRVVQASLKLVLEPIFEAEFLPCSYGFRPKRRAHDAVAEVRYLATRPRCYEWVVEGDIKACFDEIDHTALMGRVRRRIGDKRVLALVKAFLKAGILTEDRQLEDTTAGTPQGGILSPLLANVALSVLDEHIAGRPGGPNTGKLERAKRLRHGQPNLKLVRYADDWCLMIRGTRADAEALREDIAAVLATMGLRLSPDKTLITHIDDGLDFLGWRIQRHRKRGTSKHYVYVYPSKKAVMAAKRKIKTLCRSIEPNQPLDVLPRRVNSKLRGWAGCFKAGVSSAVFSYLSHYTWKTVWRRLLRKHRTLTRTQIRRRQFGGGWWPAGDRYELIDLQKIGTTRYRYRGSVIPSPWPLDDQDNRAA
jgi:RNA-directed DNA polymerase